MKIIEKNSFDFDRSIYNLEHYCIITSEKFWDGGFNESASLVEKAEFYTLANKFSKILKQFIMALDDTVVTGSYFCEKNKIFEDWTNKDDYDCFNIISQLFKRKKQYELELPNDNEYIDFIIENNFRYFTCFDLFLPKNKIVLQPTCHTEIVVYAHGYKKIINLLNCIIQEYEGFSIKMI